MIDKDTVNATVELLRYHDMRASYADAADLIEAMAAQIADLTANLDLWEGLHKAIAELTGNDPETWPDHGNAPLAIAAGYVLWLRKIADLTAKLEAAEAERDDLREAVETARIEGYEIAREHARDCGWHLLRPELVDKLK